jgi:ABC-type polysaccharide/polyol phosphate transport system ATPase subunit
MNSDVVIRAEGLGKKYLISHEGERQRYTALRDVLAERARQFARSGWGLFRRGSANSDAREEFWALKDVDFEIRRGEVLGIIGRNGAGKSTLLKVLSRITEPTLGRVEIRGQVASLLEVGTGFHPELTGRENIFLNGAILGMSRAEIRRRFDEIVAFADVERFLDTPVKRYSSGMYVRLAFAVAAYLEPEILIVDEVLAVGDAEFQKKCLGRMREASQGGRTVVFVSHNLDVVARLCGRALLLSNGTVESIGEALTTIARYQKLAENNVQTRSFVIDGATINASFAVADTRGRFVTFRLQFRSDRTIRVSEFVLIINTAGGTRVGLIDFREHLPSATIRGSQDNEFVVELENFDLAHGDYDLRLFVHASTGFVEIEFGRLPTISGGDAHSYLTGYPDQWSGITKFRGTVTHLVRDIHDRESNLPDTERPSPIDVGARAET